MNTNHEAVMEGLKNWLAGNTTGFKKYTRKELFLADVNAQPCCFVRKIGADFEFQGINQVTIIDAEIWIGCPASQGDDVAADTKLNQLLASVLDAFAPDNQMLGRFTIGGLAFWCRIEGHSDQYPGDVGNQSLCCLPVKITLP